MGSLVFCVKVCESFYPFGNKFGGIPSAFCFAFLEKCAILILFPKEENAKIFQASQKGEWFTL